MRNNVTSDEIKLARHMDLLTYLEHYDPGELVSIGNGVYCTRTHDSLKISNGKWQQWSTGKGSKTALDYLVEVKGMGLVEAVRYINGLSGGSVLPSEKKMASPAKTAAKKQLVLPAANKNNDTVFRYLQTRGIDIMLLDYCIQKQLIYEDRDRHNCVFVGYDSSGNARHATLRSSSLSSTFCRDAEGSNKQFSFKLQLNDKLETLYLFESPIDLLSYFTLHKMKYQRIPDINGLSLAGVYIAGHRNTKIPMAVSQYLKDNPAVRNIAICFDSDSTGKRAADQLVKELRGEYRTAVLLPYKFKDYNDMLRARLNITHNMAKRSDARRKDVAR